MKILVVASQKGGSGKTTLARNMAVAASKDGRRVVMIDLDPQDSLRGWWDTREAEQPSMLDRDPSPSDLPRVLDQLAADVDLVVIDTPPSAGAWVQDIMALANLVLIPVRPSPDDLRAVGPTIEAANAAGTQFAFVLSQTSRSRIVDAAHKELAEHGRVARAQLNMRVAHPETAITGEAALESPDAKAREEVQALWAFVKGAM